jgi:hypothetical protein
VSAPPRPEAPGYDPARPLADDERPEPLR